MTIGISARIEERVVWETVEKRSFLHHLEDRVLNWWSVRAGEWVQVDSNDSNAVRELLDVLASGVEGVEVIEVGQCAEELARPTHFVADDKAPFAAAFDFEYLRAIC